MLFTGKNVRLRAEAKADVAKLVAIRNEEEVIKNLSTFIPFPGSVDVGEYWFNEHLKERRSNDVHFVIELLDGTVIGACGTMNTNWKNSYTTVYIFIGGAEQRSKGYGSEALGLLVSYIFEEMNLNKVRLFVFGFNKRAVRSYEKVGFKLEGTLRQELYRCGQYNDVYQMSILKREYDQAKRGE